MILNELTNLIKSHLSNSFCVAEVKKVDGQTCDVLPIGAEAMLLGVRLMATIDDNEQGILVVPKTGSYVLIGFISDAAGEAFVSMFSEIDGIRVFGENGELNLDLTAGKYALNTNEITLNANKTTFNDGTNGGLVNVNPLIQDINTIKVFLQTLVTAIQAAPIVPSDGGGSLKASIIAAISTLPLPTVQGYEDTTVKH